MMNYSQVSYFNLTAFFDTKDFKLLCFLVIMCLYVLIIVSNVLLIVIICVNRSLHEPMYLFLCSLFVNELYGSTGVYPFLLFHILKDVHTVSASLCFLQIFCLYSYVHVEFSILTVMSYDRYLAICFPLQYNKRMTSVRVAILIALAWFYGVSFTVGLISLTRRLQLCGNAIDKVYCNNYSIVKLGCSDTSVNNIYGLTFMFTVILTYIILIIFSYMRILKVCFSGSKQTRQKAVTTCTPHLVSLISFSFGAFFETVSNRFNMNNVPDMLRIILSVYFLTVPPLFNPVLYGLKMSKIRNICKNVLLR